MGIRPEFRWWILTLGVVALLLGISALALRQPGVVWEPPGAVYAVPVPHCPHCRHEVELYAVRCAACRGELGWAPAPDEASPLSPFSLSSLEAASLRERLQELGEDEATRRVAAALSWPRDAALAYLRRVGRGRCGWCGGTGRDLDAWDRGEEPCPACLGTGQCVACGGDRRIRVGDEAADRAWHAYVQGLLDISPHLPAVERLAEAQRLGEEFLRRHAGTLQACGVLWAPDVGHGLLADPAVRTRLADPARALVGPSTGQRTVASTARERLDRVVGALAGP